MSSGMLKNNVTYKVFVYKLYIRSPTEVEDSSEGICGCHSHNAKLFEWIEHSGIRSGINVNKTKATKLMSYDSRTDVVRLLAEWYDNKSKVKFGRFRSQLQASYVSSNTEELRYNETVCLWMTIYIYIYI